MVAARLRAPVAAAALLALGCLDALSPGGPAGMRVAQLSLSPVFEGAGAVAGRQASPSDVDSFVILIVNPPRTVPDTFVRRLQPGEDTIRIALDVPVDGARDTLSVVFSGYSSVTGLLLYQGTLSVVVAPEVTVTPRTVSAAYVGPGRSVFRITASPRAAGLRRAETVQVGYTARDTAGAELPADSVPVRYSTSNSSVATVTQGGLVAAVGLGEARVFITTLASRAIEDTCVVTVSDQPAGAASLRLSPGFAVLRPSGTLTLEATARDGQGNQVSSAGTSYQSRSPGVATVNSSTGVVTGVAGGTAVIVGTLASVSDSVVVAVAENGVAVAAAIADQRAFDAAAANDTVRALVAVDLSGVAPEKLGSYNAELNWSATVLRYVRADAVSGGFTFPTLNDTETSAGRLRFGAADPNGHSGPSVGLLMVVFVANAAGSTPVTLTITEMSAAETFTNLLPGLLVYSGRVRVQ